MLKALGWDHAFGLSRIRSAAQAGRKARIRKSARNRIARSGRNAWKKRNKINKNDLASKLLFLASMATELENAELKNAELRAQVAAQEASKRSAAQRKYAEQAERRRKLAENAAEILFLRQTLQARRIQQDMAETPLDRIRRLEQSNYWLKRVLVEQEPMDYEFVDATPSQEPTWTTPKLKDKRGTHDEECVCKRCVFRFRDEQVANQP